VELDGELKSIAGSATRGSTLPTDGERCEMDRPGGRAARQIRAGSGTRISPNYV